MSGVSAAGFPCPVRETRASRAARKRGAGVVVIAAIVLALSAEGARAASTAPDALTQAWGVEVDATVLRALDRPVLQRMRAARMTLIAGPGLSGSMLRRAEKLRRTHDLPLIQPLRSGQACAAFKVSRPGHRCGVMADSVGAARALASGGEADLVVVRAASMSALSSAAGPGRILAVLPLRQSGYKPRSWLRTITTARRAAALDLAVRPGGRDARGALLRFLSHLAPLAGSDREAPAAPAALGVAGDGAGRLTATWRAPVGAIDYGVDVDGRRVTTSSAPSARLTGLTCESHLVEVDAADSAGNRSTKAFAAATPTGCGFESVKPIELGAPPTPTPTATSTATATPTPTTTPTATPTVTPDTQPPTTPQRFSSVESTLTTVAVRWDASSDDVGVAGYRLYRDGALVETTQSLSHTYLFLECGTAYTFGIEAFDASGNTSMRATLADTTAECTDMTPPSPPGGLRVVEATETSVKLAWDAATDDVGVSGYFVYRGDQLVDATPSLAVTLNVQCGTQFVFGVAARDAAGNLSTHATVTASTAACSDKTPPSTPTGVRATQTTPTSLSLAWEPSSDDVGVTGYPVERDGQLVEIAPDATVIVSGLACATQYEFGVRARDAAGNLSGRATLTAGTAECPDVTPPTQPQELRATGATRTSIALAWEPSSDDRAVLDYRIYRDGWHVTSSALTTTTVTGLVCDTSYDLAVEARDKAGNSSTRALLNTKAAECGPSEEEPADLFVSTNGSAAGACTSSDPCAGFDRAYQVSKPGDVVEVAAGTYGPQQILVAPGHEDGPDVLIRPAANAEVLLEDLAIGDGSDDRTDGPDHIAVRGMALTTEQNEPGAGNQAGIFVGPRSTYITLEDMDAGNVHTWLADHVLVLGGDYGPCHAVWPIAGMCGNSKLDASTNVTIDGATFHDYRFDETCFDDGADCHWECMYVNGGRNITITNSKFRQCALFDIFTTLSGPVAAEMGHRNLRIENNWFAAPWAEDPSGGSATRSGSVFMAWCQNGPDIGYDGVVVGFNSFEAHGGIEVDEVPECTWKDIRIVANLMLSLGCQAGWAYDYNVLTPGVHARTCASTDMLLPEAVFPYRQPGGGPLMDYHLAAPSIADDRVPVSAGCPARDFDGQQRPASGERCDAGADER